jgi:hypothetical protein
MKPIVVQLSRLLVAVLALYGVLLLVALLVVPQSSATGPIDTARAGNSLYLTEPKYVFFERKRLSEPHDRLLVLGASNAMVGFKPAELAPLVPGREVHNLSVGGSNITQVGQVAELVREVQSPPARARDVYVLGLWYGIFASNQARWHTPDREAGDTDLDIERYRYGFFRRTESGPRAVVPAELLGTAALLVHPFLALDQTTRRVAEIARGRLPGKATKLTDAQRNARVVSESERRTMHRFWRRYMGDVEELDEAAWRELSRVIDEIRAGGARVVLVDLPIPRWHREGSLLAADYRRRFDAMAPSLEARPGVQVVSLANADGDDDFSDEVHPKPRVTAHWARSLADALSTPDQGENHEYGSSLRHADSSVSRRVR